MKIILIFFLVIGFINGYDNIEINNLKEKCKNKEYSMCYDALQNYRLNREHKDTDWELVEKLYIKLCSNSYAKACMSLGNLYTVNSIQEIKADFKKSAEYNTKGCDLGDMIACNNLGVMYKYGKFYKKDYNKALKLFTKSCNNKDHSAVDKACNSKDEILLFFQENKK